MDAKEGAPIPLAAVVLTSTRTEADLDGSYEVYGLCPGPHVLHIHADGYRNLKHRVVIKRGSVRHDVSLIEGMAKPTRTAPKKEKAEVEQTLDEVLVTAKRVQERPLENRAVERLEGRELQMTRGQNLADTISGMTGVTVVKTGNISKPVINGRSANRLVLMNDGVRHENHKWGLEHGPEVDPFAASKVEVIRGAQGVRYGGDAVGGVVIMTPPEYPDAPGLRGNVGSVFISNGLQGALNGSVVGALPSSLLGGLRFRGQISARKAGSLNTPDYDLDNTATDELNFSTGLSFKRKRYNLELGFTRFASNIGVFTGQLASTIDQFREASSAARPPQVDLFGFSYGIDRPNQRVNHNTLKAKSEVQVTSTTKLNATYSFQLNNREERDVVRGSGQNRAQKDFELQTHTLQVETVSAISADLVTTLGVQGMFQRNRFAGVPFLPNFRRWVASPYALQEYFHEDFEVELGVRLEVEDRRVIDRERVGGSTAPLIITDLSYTNVVTSASVLTALSDAFSLRFDASSAARAPTIDELFIRGVSQGQPTYESGNSGLGVETTFHFAASGGYKSQYFSASAELYGDYSKDFIYRRAEVNAAGEAVVRQTTQGAFPAFVYDQDDAIFGGVNAEIKLNPASWVELKSRVAMVRAQNLTTDGFLPFVPGDQFTNRLTFLAKSLWVMERPFLWAESQVVLRQTRFDPNTDFLEPPGTYHLLNFAMGATFNTDWVPLQASVEVRNALDNRYRSYLSRLRYYADEPGISAFVRVSVPFETAL